MTDINSPQVPESTLQLSDYHQHLTQGVLNTRCHQYQKLQLIAQDKEKMTSHVRLITHPDVMTRYGSFHGGQLNSILDTASYLALLPQLKEGEYGATVAYSSQILKPITGEGQTLDIYGKVSQRGKRNAFCSAEAYNNGKLMARAQVTKVIQPLPQQSKL